MNDFDRLLATEFGLKPQGKSAPMSSSSKGSSNFTKTSSLNFDSHSRSFHSSNHDSDLFNSNPISRSTSGFASMSVNSPVYDKPLYDDDDGSAAAFDDLLGGFGHSKKTVKNERGVGDFDDLINGFGNSKSSRQRCGY